jgi:hypothetical protein
MIERPPLASSGLKSRRVFIYLALSLMTASWITGVLRAIFEDAGPRPSLTITVLTLLTLIPLALGRWLRGLELKEKLRHQILAGAFAFLCLLVVSSGFYNDYGLLGAGWMGRLLQNELTRGTFLNQITSLVLVALCWWLGFVLGDMRLTSTNLTRYFYACLLILALPSIFFVSDITQDLTWLFFLFLFSAMVMLGLGRVEEAARRSQDRGSPFTYYWLVQLGVISGILLGLVALAQALKLAYGLGLIFALAAPVVTVLIFPIVYAGAKMLVLLGVRLAVPVVQNTPGSELSEAGSQSGQAAQPSTIESLCAGLALLVLLFLVVRLAIFTSRRWREMAEDWGREETAVMPSLGDQLSQALEEQLTRLGFNLPGMGRLRRRLAARSIRRIYAALTALAADRGYPRPAARTPYEHLWSLQQAFPGCEPQLEQITEAYVAAHYGQVPDTRAALQEIKIAWDQVRETARRTAPASDAAMANI